MPVLKKKLDLSNFLNLAKELLFGRCVTPQSQLQFPLNGSLRKGRTSEVPR